MHIERMSEMSLLSTVFLVVFLTLVPMIGLSFFNINDLNEAKKVKVPIRVNNEDRSYRD